MAVLVALMLTSAISYAFPSAEVETPGVSSGSGAVYCSFNSACTAYNASGIALTLSINSTTVRSNGSLIFSVSLVNPTDAPISKSNTSAWYVPSLPLSWPCFDGSIPYAFEVFAGRYTLANISSASDIIHPDVLPACISTVRTANATTYTLGSRSTWLSFSSEIYAIPGGAIKSGGTMVGVYSLRSDMPSVYTMVAGDEWGDIVVVNFSVVQ